MTTIECYETGRAVSIPSGWDEMPARLTRKVFRLFDRCVTLGESPLDFSIRALRLLMGVKPSTGDLAYLRATEGRHTALAENTFTLCDKCLGFLFEDGDKARLGFDSVRNPLPSVRVGLHRLKGPADLLSDLSFGEFRQASAAMEAFFRSSGVDDLDECLACLYRRPAMRENKAGRKVRPLANSSFARDKALAGRMRPWQKSLVMSWFAACLRHLQEGVVTVDGEDIDMRKLFAPDGDAGGDIRFGWTDLLVEIAKQGPLGTMEEADGQPLYSVISIMWHNYKDNKRHERLAKANKVK